MLTRKCFKHNRGYTLLDIFESKYNRVQVYGCMDCAHKQRRKEDGIKEVHVSAEEEASRQGKDHERRRSFAPRDRKRTWS